MKRFVVPALIFGGCLSAVSPVCAAVIEQVSGALTALTATATEAL